MKTAGKRWIWVVGPREEDETGVRGVEGGETEQ